jgi:hypothetical protein
MTNTAAELYSQGRKNDIWTKYCGFLDLNLDDFMKIQERLLIEQINLLSQSEIGRAMFGDQVPKSVQDFRDIVPLTTYEDYVPYLEDQNEEFLPPGNYRWAYTSGRTSLSGHKWVPVPKKMYDQLGEAAIGGMLLSSCRFKGDIALEADDKLLLATAPPPYISGLLSHSTQDQMSIRFLPSLEEGEEMQFEDRISNGFDLATEFGLDYFFGLSSLLARIGEMYEKGSSSGLSKKYLKPRILFRMLKGLVKSKMQKRKMLPRDIWNLKGIMTTGTDTIVYRDKVEKYWGKKPLEGHVCTEGGAMATQAWTYYGLNFYPHSNFLEFIPYEEYLKNRLDRNYQPRTVLINEVRQGLYELVFTNLLGGVFTRYRIGDIFQVIGLEDKEAGIQLPQFRLYSRTDSLIDIGAIIRLTEVQIAQSIESTELKYENWVARKEGKNGDMFLHIYLELKDVPDISEDDLYTKIRVGLRKFVPEFPDMEELLGNNHLQVTRLVPGSWKYYKEFQKKLGADIMHLKPPRIQPTDAMMSILLERTRRK